MQWKPIAYLSSSRKYVDSTSLTVEHINATMNPEIIPSSIAKAYYGTDIIKAKMANLTMKFGVATGKHFYNTANYSSW